MLLWFGFVNHTSSERTARRIIEQTASIALLWSRPIGSPHADVTAGAGIGGGVSQTVSSQRTAVQTLLLACTSGLLTRHGNRRITPRGARAADNVGCEPP